jgi:hypothetical protein
MVLAAFSLSAEKAVSILKDLENISFCFLILLNICDALISHIALPSVAMLRGRYFYSEEPHEICYEPHSKTVIFLFKLREQQ